MDARDLEKLLVDIPDYPEPGVVFRDISPLLADPQGLAATVDMLVEPFMDAGITKVMGAEARGFAIGAPVAYKLGAGFVLARKPDKLPRATISQAYDLEYGTNELHIHADALDADDVVLVVDDLLATGGTAAAQAKLIQQTGACLAGLAFIIELAFLDPRAALSQVTDAPVHSLIM